MEDHQFAAIKAQIEEAIRIDREQILARIVEEKNEILSHGFRIGGRQNGKSQTRGQHPSHVWFDEIREWPAHTWKPDLSAVEAVAAKYATEPNYQVAGIVHRAEHYGVEPSWITKSGRG